ncbi:MAG: hypothetical protein R2762_28065 [Bryobacteraceae bacterium]
MTLTAIANHPSPRTETSGFAQCYICTHTVPAIVVIDRRRVLVKPGQKCPRCNSTLSGAAASRAA